MDEEKDISENENRREEYLFWTQQAAGEQSGYRMKRDEIPKEDAFNGRLIEEARREQTQSQSGGGYDYYSSGNGERAPKKEKRQKKAGKQKPKKPMGMGKRLALLAASAAVFGLAAGGVFQAAGYLWNRPAQGGTQAAGPVQGNPDTPIGTTKVLAVPEDWENNVKAVAKSAMPSIVAITSTVTQTDRFWGVSRDMEGSGSGIIIDKNEEFLFLVTNNHVVAGAKNIMVTFIDDEMVNAEVKGRDTSADLAVLTVPLKEIKKDTQSRIQVAAMGNSDALEVGEQVVAIGNALGYGQSLTGGYISATNRTIQVDDNTMVLLQTDAAINPGNSGGALLNMRGEVIGINCLKDVETKVEGMGFAIPISKAVPIIAELKAREEIAEEEKGYLGINLERVTEEENKNYNMPLGIFVKKVSKNGAASQAGILPGDIITAVNGMEVRTETALQERIQSYKAGTGVTVTVMRYENGVYKEMDFKVTLGNADSLKELEEEQQDSGNPKRVTPGEEPGFDTYPEEDFFDFFNGFAR